MGSDRDSPFFYRSLFGSLCVHVLLLVLVFRTGTPKLPEFGSEVVYSLTIEGGKTLGGKAQIPDNDKPQQMAPPKNVSEPEQKQEAVKKTAPEPVKPEAVKQAEEKVEEKVEQKVEEKKEQPPVEKVEPKEDAEVSLAEERERKRLEDEKRKELEEEKKRADEAKQKKEREDRERKEREKAQREKEEREKAEREKIEQEKKRVEDEKKKKEAEKRAKAAEAADVNKKLQAALQRYRGESSDAGGTGFGAASLGGKGMGGGVVRPPEFFTYKRLLEKHIKSGWHWYDTSSSLVCQVAFEIGRDGGVSNVSLYKSSGNDEYDRSVLKAVRDANPVPAPPEIVYQYFASIRMTFDPRE